MVKDSGGVQKSFGKGALFALLAQGNDLLAEAGGLLFLLGELIAQARGVAFGAGGGFARGLEQFDGAVDLFFQRKEIIAGNFGFAGSLDGHRSFSLTASIARAA